MSDDVIWGVVIGFSLGVTFPGLRAIAAVGRKVWLRSLPPAARAELDTQPRADLTPVMRRDRAALRLLTEAESLVLQHLSAGPSTTAAIGSMLLPHGPIETSRIGGLLPTMERAGLIEWQRTDERAIIANFGLLGAGLLGSGTMVAITLRGREALAGRCPTNEIHRAEEAT